jgi:uncharacterized protein YdeI (YjbR/CyaY-like superfamily)
MERSHPLVDDFLEQGCGRCSLGGTPECKVHRWPQELRLLRKIALASGLKEERKWGVPCYTFEGKNILLIGAFNDYASLSFLKGALIKDEAGLLQFAGEQSQSAKYLKVRNVKELAAIEKQVQAYIQEAIEMEKRGEKVVLKKIEEYDLPSELQDVFAEDAAFEKAFRALSPGRQRGYLIFFSQAKQSATRSSRILKSRERIFQGKGMHD